MKINRISLYASFLLIPFLVSMAYVKGKMFPSLSAETIESKTVTIPTDTKGKYTLVGLAYSQKAQDDLNTWLQPVYDAFIAKPTKPVLFDESYDIHLYLVMMFTGANESYAGQAKKKLQELDKELKPHVLIYKGDITKYKDELALTEKDKPYFFLMDQDGKIVHTISGAYSEAKMEKIQQILDE